MSDGGSLGNGNGTPAQGAASATHFRDRLLPTPGVWAVAASVPLLFGIAGLRAGVVGGVVSFLIVFGLVGGFLMTTTPRIEVSEGMFVAGGARIPVSLLGEAQVLDAEQWRLAVGQELDARAFLCIRGWIKQGVRVQLEDPEDPTPYWVVSCRRPTELLAALTAARTAR